MNKIEFGDCRDVMRQWAKQGVKVQMCVTSPPYYQLRSYGTETWEGGDDNCNHLADRSEYEKNFKSSKQATIKGTSNRDILKHNICPKCGAKRIDKQLGLEESVEEYVENLVEVFRCVKDILKDDGTVWLNLGDSYAGNCSRVSKGRAGLGEGREGIYKKGGDLPAKNLIGVPWRVAFALQADGWILRQEITWCLSSGTYVYAKTDKGIILCSLRDLTRSKPSTVKLWNGEKWTQLLGMSKHKDNNIIQFELRSGERISCTSNHKFPTERGLLEAKDIQVGDTLKKCRLPEPENPRDCIIDEDAAWFAGLFLAEGSFGGIHKETIQISGHVNNIERWEKVKKIATKFGGYACKTDKGNLQSIRVRGKILNAIVRELIVGKNAYTKHFAPVVWRYSNKFISSLLDSYLIADGHYDESNNRWRLGFCRNYALERDLRTVCSRLGYKLKLKRSYAKCEGKTFKSFRGELRKITSGHLNEKRMEDIVDIKKSRCSTVYDLGVEDEPNLFSLSSGILTHNCKPNAMPSSALDRCTGNSESIFLLAKNPRYFFDNEAIKEKAKYAGDKRGLRSDSRRGTGYNTINPKNGETDELRNKRSVWTIPTKPFGESHFACYPPALILPCILAGTSAKGECPYCGKAWIRITTKTRLKRNELDKSDPRYRPNSYNGSYGDINGKPDAGYTEVKTLGWEQSCGCKEHEAIPQVVLDPFMGSGTTAMVAKENGRFYLGCELNPDYKKMQDKRINSVQHQMKMFM